MYTSVANRVVKECTDDFKVESSTRKSAQKSEQNSQK